ncbi:neuron navigator 2-like isoform X4 [Liolophura sinensis]|uniref:neuron navigator 2-like isoform X4 n=1 Tax=Liolophura sinensis TaxID=3198878 RepID=UPI0031592B76
MVLEYIITAFDTVEPKTYTAEIYTDWANHYLEKARNKRFISDLQEDITDGVLLADVIEAVTNEKVKDIKMKPKNSAQMVENINNCLTFLGNLGVNVEGLSAKDIKDGNLKAILGLFFSLSRFKQQQKSQQQSHKGKDKDKDSDKEKTVQINTDPPPSGENKGQGGGCNSSASCGGSTPTQPNQLNGGEMISRLPSPFSKSNKSSLSSASVNKVESSNANANSRLKSSNSERLKAQLNQQNNNIQPQNSGTSQLNSKNLNNNCSKETPSGIPTRATSPGGQHSGIPTPGGRLLGSVRGQSFSDKHASKLSTSTSSTSSTGSGTGSSGTSCKGLQKGGAANKNSMLDKFKFFNSKEKEKSKSGVAKSASKSSTAASATSSSSKSESDSRSGLNLRGTNATDGATSGSSSPKTGIRGLKKGWGRSSSKRDAASHKKASEDNASKRSTPSPSPSPQGQPPLPGSGLASGHRNSPTPSRKAASAKSSDKNDKHASQHSPPSSKKGSKVSSLIPKSASGCKPKTSTSSNSLSSAAGIQPASHIPGYASTGIPKPGGKTGKSSSEKGDKSKSGSSKESKSNGNGSISQKSSSVGSKSSQAQQLPQQLAQHPGMSYAENGSYGKAKSTDVRLESRVDRMHNAISNNSSANTQYSKNSMSSSPAPSSAPPLPPRNPNMSGRPITPQNVPKMDQSTQYTTNSRPLPNSGSLAKNLNNQSSASKSDGNTQTSLSALQRVVSPGKSPPMKDVSNASISSNDSMSTGATSQSDSTPSSNSGGNKSGSSNESVIFRPSSCDELSGSEKSVSNSPKLGVKSLLSQSPSAKIHVPHVSHVSHPQPSTVTQPTHPRPTEKMETTFDTEVRTETISNVPKETTFSDKQETTFTDDSGETLDIKPMQPIMRALPYGYFRGLTSAAGANKNFHIPGISVPTSMYGSISSRLAINRSLADPSRMYPHPVKKAGSHVLEPDYGSDLDTYDYVSGYMSDGDILKSNRLDDSCSGYMSEGGASLYARRLQQRFREGMQAVKECMQKSSGLIDDDSFDDSSSISSGEISDTIAEISTDENLTGSSQSACSDHTNPFSSLKRVPKDILRVTPNGSVPINGKRNLLIASNGREYYAPEYNGAPSWRKFSMPSTGKYFSDQEDYGNPYNGYDQWHRSDPNGIIPPGRKLSITSQPELGSAYYRPDSGSYSESDRSSYMSTCSNKRECETNTDQSFLQDNMRKMQARSSNSLGTAYGYRRPLSNTSTCSVGSNKSTGSKGSVSGRLVKNGTPTDRFSDTASVKSNPERLSSYDNVPTCIPRPASATPRTMTESGSNGFHRDPRTDMGPEAYNSSTLERRKRGNFASSRSLSSGSAQTDTELYKSNTLGRRRLFGSKNSLSKGTSAVHGSNLSLVSNSSSVYSSAEEKQAHEIRKLRRELEHAQEKVITLTTQLSANRIGGYGNNPQFLAASSQQAHVVAAFEQSLSNMTARLQHLTTTAEHKDSELNELRATIEALKRQSSLNIPEILISPNAPQKHSTPVIHSAKDQHLHVNGTDGRSISRQMSSDSMSSINSLSSACSVTSQQSAATDGDCKSKKKKKGWLRSSFSKAFSRKKSKHGSMSDCEPDTASLHSDMSAPNSPLLQNHMVGGSPLKGSQSMVEEGTSSVTDLKKQLREKDMKLTDIRLEALTSAHQLEQLKETMSKMKNEMSALKADNDRLHKMMSSRSLNTSQSSLQQRSSSDSLERALSMGEQSSLDILTLQENIDREGKRVTITVILGSNPDPLKRVEKLFETLIGSLSVSGKTKWDILDSIVRKIFKEYVLRVDPVTNLGLNAESVYSYHVGEITRTKDAETPELLPVGYLVGDTMQIGICLKGTHQNSVDSLAFETLIPKSIVQRYVSLLLEHRRIILCGPSGTGKTYLAQKLSEHLVLRSGKKLTAGSIATFNVDHKSAKELRQYLSNIAEQCESTSVGELPSVIILDNLHHVGSLGEVFNGFLSVKYQKCPYIIGTMNQATCSTTNLQLHHNFRWVLCANHMEPVKGFLGRFLRRKLVEAEVRMGTRNNDLNKIIDWIPKVWQHLNKFLETHSSSDVTIGPRLFLSCPMDIAGSQVWFTDLWNYSIIPYLLEAVREGLQMYGKRAPWEDPADWVIETYPWSNNSNQDWPSLLRLRPEDVGFDTQGVAPPQIKNNPTIKETTSEGEGDPLMSMLMRLQEAASYSSPQSNDSDSTSLDSHSSIIQEVSTSSAEST